MSLPRTSFARRIINLMGYTSEEEITEVAHADKVNREEAARRIAVAIEQKARRSSAQWLRHQKSKDRVQAARRQILAIAHHEGRFLCAERLEDIAFDAGWESPQDGICRSRWDTGRVFREMCLPMERAGLLARLRDPEEDRFIGYTLTDAGRKEFLGE